VRRRFLTATLLVAVLAVAVLGVPLAYVGSRLVRSEVLRQLDSDADGVALAVEAARAAGIPLAASDLGRFATGGRTVVATTRTGKTLTVGRPPAHLIRSAVVVTSDGTRIQVERSSAYLAGRTVTAWTVVAALGAAGVAAAAGVALLQARRLARPLDVLAAGSGRLGSGDFSARIPSAGIAEIDAVVDALNASAGRIGKLVTTERQFSVDASHQLRTPLTAMRLRLEELATTDDLDLVHREAEAALVQADRLAATITELLELRRQGRVGQQVPVDLARLAAQHLSFWELPYKVAGRSVQIRPGRPASVQASPGAVGQALDVLLDNALRHGTGTVTVQVRRRDRAVTVSVADEGKGMNPDVRARLFTRNGSGDAHGVGLALARTLVESDLGRLHLAGDNPMTFEIVFPSDTP